MKAEHTCHKNKSHSAAELVLVTYWLFQGACRHGAPRGYLECRSQRAAAEGKLGRFLQESAVLSVGCSMGIAPAQTGELSFSEHSI